MEVVGPQLQSVHANVVRGLAEQELTQFAGRLQCRILQSAPMSEEGRTKRATTQKQIYKLFVESNSSFYEELVQESGLASAFDFQQLVEEGSDIHILQNTSMHTDDWRLGKDADRLMRRGFVDLMKEELPYQCALVMHLEWILSYANGLTRY
ncbi:TPA: hypothetical protein ACH3X3_008349 [Trebouxia sp. C0006]